MKNEIIAFIIGCFTAVCVYIAARIRSHLHNHSDTTDTIRDELNNASGTTGDVADRLEEIEGRLKDSAGTVAESLKLIQQIRKEQKNTDT